MAHTLQSLYQTLEGSVTPNLQRALMRVVYGAYKSAADSAVAQFEPAERAVMMGYVRRAKIEQGLRGLADRFPGVVARTFQPKHSAWAYTTLAVGEVLLTASMVSGPDRLPKHADFRQDFSVQCDLFGGSAEEAPCPTIYGILVHGASSNDLGLPGFIRLAVPSAGCRSTIADLDLMMRHPGIVGEFVPEEQIAQPNAFKLKARRDDAEEG